MLQLVYAPNPIFKQKAEPVAEVNDQIRDLIQKMFKTMYHEGAVGMGANMVGILKRIAIVDIQKPDFEPLALINPEIVWKSQEMETCEEGSVCFPGISAMITRPAKIKVKYLDENAIEHEKEFDGPMACVIQHEVDYLDGIVFLDYLSKLKQEMLIKKMLKFMKLNPPHVHSSSCKH